MSTMASYAGFDGQSVVDRNAVLEDEAIVLWIYIFYQFKLKVDQTIF